jgi:hypothetical protein
MQKFEYRSPRFSVDLPVRFSVESTTVTGRSKDIGQDGMTLDLREPVQAGDSGMLSLTHQGRMIEIRARVAHVEGTHTGLEFLHESEAERSAITQLVANLATVSNRPGPVLLH